MVNARLWLREQEVPGSNPGAPIETETPSSFRMRRFLFSPAVHRSTRQVLLDTVQGAKAGRKGMEIPELMHSETQPIPYPHMFPVSNAERGLCTISIRGEPDALGLSPPRGSRGAPLA